MRRSLVTRILVCTALVCSMVVMAPASTGAVMVSPWRWQNPLPRGDSLNDVVWIPGTDVVWAVGNYGCIMKSYDATYSWIAKNSGTNFDLAAAGFTDSSHGWVVGASGTGQGILLRTTDGASFSAQTLPAGADAAQHGLTDISVVDATHAFAVGYGGYIIKTTDGTNWTTLTTAPDIGNYTAVFFLDSNNGWVAREGGIWHTHDAGANWTDMSLTGFKTNDMFFTDANHGWIVGYDNGGSQSRIFCTNNNTNWANVPPGTLTNGEATGVCFTSPSDGWIITSAGEVWHTTDGNLGNGSHWSQYAPYGLWGRSGYAISFGSATKGAFVGVNGTIASTTNTGTNWARRTSASDDPAWSIDFPSASVGYAVSYSDVIKTTDGGESWSYKTTGGSGSLKSLDFVDTQTGYAVGATGYIMKTTNGGENWTPLTSASYSELRSVCALDATHAWICDYAGKIQATTNGTDWTVKYTAAGPLYGIDFFDTLHGVAVGDSGRVYWTENGGDTWTAGTSNTTQHIWAVQMVSATKAYCVGWALPGTGRQLISVTTDGGKNWDLTTGASPVTWSDLYGVSFSSETEGWAVGVGGVILHTTDGGMNWYNQQVSSETLVTVCSIPGTTKAWAGGYGGMILTNTPKPAPPAPKKIVWRFYNIKNGSHLYTADPTEKQNIIATLSDTYNFEDVCYVYDESKAEMTLFRFYKPSTNSHFYSADPTEIANVKATLSGTYAYEGPVYNVSFIGGQPVWRFFNKKNGTHFYTADQSERDNVIANLSGTYQYENVAFYLPQ